MKTKNEIKKANKKTLKGRVVSNRGQKTAIVEIERLKKHPRYLKYFKTHKRIFAHDEKNEYKKGDMVIIEECRPISKNKSWTVKEKINKEK